MYKNIQKNYNFTEDPAACCDNAYDLVTIIDTATDNEEELREMAAFALKFQRGIYISSNCSRGSIISYDNEGATVSL